MVQPHGKTCQDIATEYGVALVTVRRWAKAAGFRLGWGGGKMSYFEPEEVDKIVSMRVRVRKAL